jgi:hypothetical protein
MTLTTRHRCEPIAIGAAHHTPAPLITRITPAPPRCSRCRSRRVQTFTDPWGSITYTRQCSRCVAWSRGTRRDPTKCLDCRQTIVSDLPRRFRLRRCDDCQNLKLARARRQRRIDARVNPLSPFFSQQQHAWANDGTRWFHVEYSMVNGERRLIAEHEMKP